MTRQKKEDGRDDIIQVPQINLNTPDLTSLYSDELEQLLVFKLSIKNKTKKFVRVQRKRGKPIESVESPELFMMKRPLPFIYDEKNYKIGFNVRPKSKKRQ